MCGGVESGGKMCRGVESGGKLCGGVESGGKVCEGLDGGGEARTSGAISISRRGMVEETPVIDIILDTGCAPTLLGEHLVPTTKKIAGEAMTLRCAHGDTVLYPVAEVDVVVDGVPLVVKAALSATLPVSVLLGTDVPELGRLLQTNPLAIHTPGASEVYVVTRARAKELEKDECDRLRREAVTQVHPTPITESETTTWENAPLPIGASLHDDLFTPYAPKPRLTRRAEQKLHGRVQRPTQDDSGERNLLPLPSTGELRTMQGQDESLQGLHELARSNANPNPILVVDGLLYRRWTPRNPRY